MADKMTVMKNSLENPLLGAGLAAGVGTAGVVAGMGMSQGNQDAKDGEGISGVMNGSALRNFKLFDLGSSKGTQEQPLTESAVTPVVVQPVDYIQQGLQNITDQTDLNNQAIAALQGSKQTPEVRNQIRDLETQNIGLMAQADDLMGGYNRENVQNQELAHYRKYNGGYQRGKDFLYDNAGVYFSRLGNGLSSYFDSARSSLSNVWQGFSSLGIRDRFNMIVEGMKSVASSTADLPVGAARQLAAAYRAMMAKIKRNKKTVEVAPETTLTPAVQAIEVPASEAPVITDEVVTSVAPNFAESGM